MRIAIISDSHDNLANIKKAIDWLNKEKISLLLHCGDISSRQTLDEITKSFSGGAKFVRGNADFDLQNLSETGEVDIDNRKIAFTHFPENAEKLVQTQKYDIVFYGHTHEPGLKKTGNCRLVNPGELSGQFHKPTFAVYDTDTDNLELKILEKLE